MAPSTTNSSGRTSVVDDEDIDTYSNVNDGLANMPDILLNDLSACFERLYDPYNFDHLAMDEQLKKYKQRDLSEGRLYQIAKKFFRGNMRPRKRVFNAPAGYKIVKPTRDAEMIDHDELEPHNLHTGQLRIQDPKPKALSPRDIEAQEKQEKVDDYRKWLEERKKMRGALDNMGLDVNWLLNKSDRSPLEERMLQDMLDKLRKPKAPTPEGVQVKRKKSAKKDPFIRRPVPRILYIVDKHLRVNRIRLIDFFQRTDKSKTWDIDRPEFRKIFATNNLPIKEVELDEMFVCFDRNLNEFIDYRDLAEAMSILRLEKRQIRRTIASGKTITAEDWDSMFSAPSTKALAETNVVGSRPGSLTPNQLAVPPSDMRKEQFILSSDEAMVDLRKRDKEALKVNMQLALQSMPPQPGDPEYDEVYAEANSPTFISPRQEIVPFKTGRGPTRSPQWFPEPSRTAGRNTGVNRRENFPDEEISRPNTKLHQDPLLIPDEEDEKQRQPSSLSRSVTKSASSGATRKTGKTPRSRSNSPKSRRSCSPSGNRNAVHTASSSKRLAKTPQSMRTTSRKSSRLRHEVSGMIKTGVKAIDDHMRPSVLGGETAEMVDKFRQLKLKEYYEILKLCQQNDVVFNEALFQRVLLHPGDKAPRELRKIRQPANPLMSAHFADPPQRERTPTIIKQKGKLKQTKNGDILINSRHLYKQKDQITPQSERVELSTGRAIVSRKVDCWMTYEEYCDLTSKYGEHYIKMNGHVNEDAFWPGYMLDKMRLHMPDSNDGTGKNAIFSNTKQRAPANIGYFHKEMWPQNDRGYVTFGDITLNPRRY